MVRLFFAALALIGLAACVPAPNSSYPENYTAANCFTGNYVFDLGISMPAEYGQIVALTQYSNGSGGLEPVCRLEVPLSGRLSIIDTYPIYAGEVDQGRDGICVSARTTNAGHVLSCASSAEVRRAITAPIGSTAAVVLLNRWQNFPNS